MIAGTSLGIALPDKAGDEAPRFGIVTHLAAPAIRKFDIIPGTIFEG